MKKIVRLAIGITLLATAVSPAADPQSPAWKKIEENQVGRRDGSAIVYASDLKQPFLVGLAEGAPFVQAFDPRTNRWNDFSDAQPFKSDRNNYNKQPAFSYRAAYDPASKSIFCLSTGDVLYSFDVVLKTWKSYPPAPELADIAWSSMAIDPDSRKLVVVGAEKRGDRIGWSRTVVFDIASSTWQRLEVNDPPVLREHEQWIDATESLIDLGGRIRSMWYRDPQGVGSETDRATLIKRCSAVRAMPAMSGLSAELDHIVSLLQNGKTLEALKATRSLQRKAEELAEAQFPVPCSRRNSPLVYEPQSKRFILFGGDHQDYLMNDTWSLSLATKSWQRVQPDRAPSPRAGHALVAIPGTGKIAMYEGYIQSPSTDYGATGYAPITPAQLWLFDVASGRWSLAGHWPAPDKKDTGASIAPLAFFYGGEGRNRYAAPLLTALDANQLLIVTPDTQNVGGVRWRRPAATWSMQLDAGYSDIAATEKFSAAPNARLYRPGLFRAEYCEVDLPAPDTGLDRLPANQWVKLPSPPRNPAQGCRGRDWSTCVWDSDRQQILMWGGGHCVRSSSTVLHYSPSSGRMVEGFDADESYGTNSPADGSLAHDSTILGRPWVAVHNYKHYAYDPVSKLLVSGRGYLYDPDRMDWIRQQKQPLPYDFRWGANVLATSNHGVVAWAPKPKGEDSGLWLYDRAKGWTDLEPKGRLPMPWCDTHGMVYDAQRDRMIFSGAGGGYGKSTDGSLLTFDFATRTITRLTPDNIDLGKTEGCLRELAYVEHADWMLLGLTIKVGDRKTGKAFTRVYDCKANRYFLLDAGPVADSHESGWMYDAHRKLVYSFDTHGNTWAMRIDPTTARRLNEPE